MELSHILNRIAEGLIYVDTNAEIYNSSRNGIESGKSYVAIWF
jgi:hypothetical protein